MIPAFEGRSVDASGNLLVLTRSGAGIPASSCGSGSNGWARDPVTGYSYVEDAGSAAPPTKRMFQGLAFTPDGALYITDSAPGAGVTKAGMVIRSDGALHVDSVNAGSLIPQGSGIARTGGRLCVAGAYASPLNRAAWWRFNTGITLNGTAVSQWDDQTSNARHLKQSSGTSQPALQADGSIRFLNSSGDVDFLKTDTFTQAQPFTVYLLMKQVTWNALGNNPRVFAGNTNDVTIMYQIGTTPNLRQYAGNAGADNANLALNTYGVVASVYNGASALTQVNTGTAATGSCGAQSMTAFTLAANGGGGSGYADIEVKEIILYSAAHDAATRARIISYLGRVGGISV